MDQVFFRHANDKDTLRLYALFYGHFILVEIFITSNNIGQLLTVKSLILVQRVLQVKLCE
jgi:hypothetical protein